MIPNTPYYGSVLDGHYSTIQQKETAIKKYRAALNHIVEICDGITGSDASPRAIQAIKERAIRAVEEEPKAVPSGPR